MEKIIPTETNCNYWLKKFSKDLESIGNKIDECMRNGKDPITYVQSYDELSDIQADFIRFRLNHDCLLEGDPGYGPE